MAKWFKQAINRCKAQTPKVFRKVQYVAGIVGTVVVAVNAEFVEYGASLPDWWGTSLPYIVGFSTGLVTLSQFTQSYDSNGEPIYKEQKQ